MSMNFVNEIEWFQLPGAKINIVDTTLRDGEQTAGVVFANPEKIRIAKMLNDIGIDQIEAGIPVMGGSEKESKIGRAHV